MKNTRILEFDELWSQLKNRTLFEPSDSYLYSHLIGFHVYADLRFNLALAAAEDPTKAMKCVSLLEDFTEISNRCAALVNARILEVQGERIHFALPVQDPVRGLTDLLRFSSALTRAVYANLKPDAGNDWQGFSMAADHGPAVFVPSTFGGGSLVSLGNAANQPAKKLGKGVESGHLAIPNRIGRMIPGAKPSGDWVQIDVNNPTLATKEFFDESLFGAMNTAAQQVLNRRNERPRRDFANRWHDGILLGATPLRTQGMCLRADLDGFTKSVEEAFATNKVPDLVRRFGEIMQYPVEVIKALGRHNVEIPWAGDCCTILVQPGSGESIEELRAVLPVVAGRHWHGLSQDKATSKRWSPSMGSAKWAVGFACGDADEGGNGTAIVTEFAAAGRTFRVLVGWCARRARDAQECPGVLGDDVALPGTDFQNLEPGFKPLFARLGTTDFRRTSYDCIKNAGSLVGQTLEASECCRIVGVSTALPAPKPFWHGA